MQSNSAQKLNIPKLNLDTVFANEKEEELSNFNNVEQADVQIGEDMNEANNEFDGEATKKAKVNVQIDILEEQPEDEQDQQNDNPFGEVKEPEGELRQNNSTPQTQESQEAEGEKQNQEAF